MKDPFHAYEEKNSFLQMLLSFFVSWTLPEFFRCPSISWIHAEGQWHKCWGSVTQLVSGFFGFFRVTDRNLSPIKQGLWSNGAYRQQDNSTIKKQDNLKRGQWDDGTTRQRDRGTTGQANIHITRHQSARQSDNETIGQRYNQTMGQQNNGTTGKTGQRKKEKRDNWTAGPQDKWTKLR